MGMVDVNGHDLVEKLAHLLGDGRERRVGDGWIVPCTAHDDSNPSLTLNVGEKQPAVWYCQAGCPNDDVMRGMIRKGIPPEAAGLESWPGEQRKARVIPFERRQKSEQKKAEDEWTPLVPVPDDAPAWHKSPGSFAAWEYRSLDKRLIGYIERHNVGGGKQFYPSTLYRNNTTGELSWRRKAFPTPRPLYGQQHLAERPGVRVLIVAGEKCADSGVRCVSNRVTVSASGGEKAVAQTDWTPLNGREVDIWPDNDVPGQQFSLAVKAHLLGLDSNRSIRILRLPDDFPHKIDIADLEAGTKGPQWQWTAQEISTFVDTECVPQIDIVLDRSSECAGAPDESRFVVLGHDKGEYFFRHTKDPQILKSSAHQMSPNFLMSLAPLGYWERRYAGKTGCDWTAAKSDLMQMAHDKGIFREDDKRGRGAWTDRQKGEDSDRLIWHIGSKLIIDGKEVGLSEWKSKSRCIYEAKPDFGLDLSKPLNDKESMWLLDEICSGLQWRKPISAFLFAGWLVLATVRWRARLATAYLAEWTCRRGQDHDHEADRQTPARRHATLHRGTVNCSGYTRAARWRFHSRDFR